MVTIPITNFSYHRFARLDFHFSSLGGACLTIGRSKGTIASACRPKNTGDSGTSLEVILFVRWGKMHGDQSATIKSPRRRAICCANAIRARTAVPGAPSRNVIHFRGTSTEDTIHCNGRNVGEIASLADRIRNCRKRRDAGGYHHDDDIRRRIRSPIAAGVNAFCLL